MNEKLFNRVFEILNSMAGSGEILWKIHFDTCIGKDGNYILRLNYKALTEKLLKFFYDNYIRRGENSSREVSSDEDEAFKVSVISMGINPDSLRDELRRKSYCIQSSYPVNFYPRGGEGRKLIYRAALLDIYKLQTAGVNIDHLLSDNRQER
jgi:hypothetical protein